MAAPWQKRAGILLVESSIPSARIWSVFERNGKVYHVATVKNTTKTKQLITLEGNANDAVRLCVRTTFHGLRTSPSRHVLSVAELVRYLEFSGDGRGAVLANKIE